MFPERFSNLPAYAFPRLRALLDVHAPAAAYADDVVNMTIGEPRHAFPAFVSDVLAQSVAGFSKYPVNEGTPELRAAMADWVRLRYGVGLNPETQIMALNGTREGLYNAAMALCPEIKGGRHPVVEASLRKPPESSLEAGRHAFCVGLDSEAVDRGR